MKRYRALCFMLLVLAVLLVLGACGADVAGPADDPADHAARAQPGDDGQVGDLVDEPGSVAGLPQVAPPDLAFGQAEGSGQPPGAADSLSVHFIDVGQGDAILIEARPGLVALIDGGTRAAGRVVVDYLVARGIREIDLLIATHPHADHIGGLIEVLEAFAVHRVIDAGIPHTTKTYEEFLLAVDAQTDCRYETPSGQTIQLAADITLTVLGPDRTLPDVNDNSIVCRLDFGQTSFLFTGDAEHAAEARLLERRVNLTADVLKVGHHGSSTSTTPPFLSAVDPTHAVLMVGADNSYGHPTQQTLSRLEERGAWIYRNDLQGTVVFTSTGTLISTPNSPDPVPAPVAGTINLNAASLERLQEIVHIGPDRAQQIIDLRPFSSVDDLARVPGIGPAHLVDIRNQGRACVE